MESVWKPNAADISPVCPRCGSSNTKFCYYNNYSLSQPRYFCKGCRRYWTKGGSLRNVPIGGGCRKSRRSGKSVRVSSSRAVRGGGIESTSGTNENPSSSSNNALIDIAAVYANYLNPKPQADMVRSSDSQLPENGFMQAISSFDYPNFVSLGNIDYHVGSSTSHNLQIDHQGFSTGFLDCAGPSYRDILTENRLLGDGTEVYYDGIDLFQKLDNPVTALENNFGSNISHLESSNSIGTLLPPLPGEDIVVPWSGSDVNVVNDQALNTTTHHHVITGQVDGQDLGSLNGNNLLSTFSPSSNLEAIFRP